MILQKIIKIQSGFIEHKMIKLIICNYINQLMNKFLHLEKNKVIKKLLILHRSNREWISYRNKNQNMMSYNLLLS